VILLGTAAVWSVLGQGVRIEELMPADAGTLPDEDGDYPGWVELYNAGQQMIDLRGHGLSDDPAQPFKWTFPALRLEPGRHLIVFTSGKDRRETAPAIVDPEALTAGLPTNVAPGLLLWFDAGDFDAVMASDGKVAGWADKSGRAFPAPAQPPASPDQIAGLILWLDGADTNRVVLESGRVAQWLDKSGHTNDASQGTAAWRPVYSIDPTSGLPLLRFNGLNNYLTVPRLNGMHTIIWVAREEASASDEFRPVIGDSEYADFNRGEHGTIFLASDVVAAFTNHVATWLNGLQVNPFKTALPKVMAVVSSTSGGPMRANHIGNDRLMSNRYWSGDVAEVVAYDRVLSTDERVAIERYLIEKWKPPLGPPLTNFDASQPNLAQQPAYSRDVLSGRPVLRFDGVDDFLSFPRVHAIRTLCWVARGRPEAQSTYRTVVGDRLFYDFHRGGDGLIYSPQYTPDQVVTGRTWLNGKLVDPLATDLPGGWAMLLTETTAEASADLIGSDRFLDGYYWAGDIGEVIAYDRPLTDEQRAALQGYLRAKWLLPPRYLHTSFTLSAGGKWLTLTSPQGLTVDQAPPQAVRPDLSLGRAANEPGAWAFFTQPTPGQANAAEAFTAVAPEPTLVPRGGFFTNAIIVSVPTKGLAGLVGYTLDGSEPAEPLTNAVDVVWIEDALPRGAVPSDQGEEWDWQSSEPQPFSGAAAHRSPLANGMHQHYFGQSQAPLLVAEDESLIAYVYLDSEHPPRQIMLQWHTGQSWDHRAYWGENLINLGQAQSASRQYMGELPPAGRWVRLEVPPSVVELVDQPVDGMAFTLFDGQATWDHVGRATTHPGPTRAYVKPLQLTSNTVVRARWFQPGAVSSRTVTASYLVVPQGTLPVISLVTSPANLFDEQTGVYVRGPRASRFVPFPGANFWQDWERPVHVEFYEPSGQLGFSLDGGIKIHGGFTRSIPQKSFGLLARRKYGDGAMRYPVFPDVQANAYESLVLRNGGNDWASTLFRDPFIQSLGADLGVDHQAARPVTVYLNGQYWGVYTLQEHLDSHYLATHHGVAAEGADIIDGGTVVDAGDRRHYDALVEFVTNHDLRDPANLAQVATLMDLASFRAYQITEVFSDNTDWPLNNVLAWRPRTPGGRWRWLLKDMDGGFDIVGKGAGRDALAIAMAEGEYSTVTLLLRKLLQNDSFRQQFASDFADALNTVFKPEAVLRRMNDLQAQWAPEIERHLARWVGEPRPGWTMFTNVAEWNANVEVMRAFARERPAVVWQFLVDDLGLAGRAHLTVTATEPDSGRLQVNRIVLTQSSLPWTGVYFQGVPLTVAAMPQAGYQFAGWLGSASTNATLTLTLTNDLELTAVFVRGPDPDDSTLRPRPCDLFQADYAFTAFPATAPAQTYPTNMLFLQTATKDPELGVEMDSEWALPYDRTTKSRVRGLGPYGFSFLNTGETQPEAGAGFLGAALLAIRTLGVTDVQVTWTAGTVAPNSRVYGIRLQYRVGTDGAFADVLDAAGEPVDYLRSLIVGDTQAMGPVTLPTAANNQRVVQLRWKYYYVPTAATGARAELRVSDIRVTGTRHVPVLTSFQLADRTLLRAGFTGGAGRDVHLLVSTNLVDWAPAGALKAGADGSILIETPIRFDWPAGFFKLRLP
jgi:hypothetical protein